MVSCWNRGRPRSPLKWASIAQLVLVPVVQAEFEVVSEFHASERGAGGFGSTGSH